MQAEQLILDLFWLANLFPIYNVLQTKIWLAGGNVKFVSRSIRFEV